MQHWVKSSVVASVLLTGCSLFQSEPVQTKQSANRLDALQVPAGLQAPAQPAQFDIPPAPAQQSEADVRSPALVLATAASSRVEEGEKLARVWFDRNDYTGDLLPFLQQMLRTQFTEQGIELVSDDSGLNYTTGWISRFDEQGFWFWKSEQVKEQARFRITLEPRPHGRSASMTVNMIEHQYFTPEAQLSGRDAQRQEMAVLNQIIDRIGKEEIAIALTNKAKAPDVALGPGMDADGNPALLTPQSIDVAWSQLEAVFAELGLEVTDMNRSAFTYYLSYEKTEPGLWSQFWGNSAKPLLPVADGEYQLILSRADKQTALSLRDKSGAYLNAETVLALHQPFVEAIRLARVEL